MPVNPMPAAPAAAMITFFFVSLVARHRSLALLPRPNLLPFLGCFINTSLSFSLSRFFFSSSSSQTWSHYKICCCERCYFQIAGDFSSFLGEVVGAFRRLTSWSRTRTRPTLHVIFLRCFLGGWGFFWREVFFLCLGCDQENQRVGIFCGSYNNGGGGGRRRRRRRRKPGGERNQGFVAGEVCRDEWQQGQEKTHL